MEIEVEDIRCIDAKQRTRHSPDSKASYNIFGNCDKD